MIEGPPIPIDLVTVPVSALTGEQLGEFATATGALIDSIEEQTVLTYPDLSIHFAAIPYLEFESNGNRPSDFPIHQGAVVFSTRTRDFTFVQPPHIPGDDLVYTVSVKNGRVSRRTEIEHEMPEEIKKAFKLATQEREIAA